MIIQDLGKSIEEYKAKLVIVDSIIALHRAEFIGRNIGRPPATAQHHASQTSRLVEVHNIAVVVTNQVQSQMISFQAVMG